MFCKRCGKEIENDVAFCEHCGCPTAESADVPAAPAKQPADGLGIASMVLGIISLVSFGSAFVLGVVGIVLGIVSLVQRGQRRNGTSVYAVVGIVTGALSIIALVALVAAFLIRDVAKDIVYYSYW